MAEYNIKLLKQDAKQVVTIKKTQNDKNIPGTTIMVDKELK